MAILFLFTLSLNTIMALLIDDFSISSAATTSAIVSKFPSRTTNLVEMSLSISAPEVPSLLHSSNITLRILVSAELMLKMSPLPLSPGNLAFVLVPSVEAATPLKINFVVPEPPVRTSEPPQMTSGGVIADGVSVRL